MSNQIQNSDSKTKFDLIERTAHFGQDVIQFCQKLPRGPILNPLITQLIKSSTSIGANYMEADGAESKKDFYHKIGICKKEAKETMHWLRMMAEAAPENKETCRKLWKEDHELTLIFSAIVKHNK